MTSSFTKQNPEAVHINMLLVCYPLFYSIFCFVRWARLQFTVAAHGALHFPILSAQQNPLKGLYSRQGLFILVLSLLESRAFWIGDTFFWRLAENSSNDDVILNFLTKRSWLLQLLLLVLRLCSRFPALLAHVLWAGGVLTMQRAQGNYGGKGYKQVEASLGQLLSRLGLNCGIVTWIIKS